MDSRTVLLKEIEAHLALTGEPLGDFGQNAASDPGFVSKLRRGRDIRLSTVDRVRSYMKASQAARLKALQDAEIAARKCG